MRSRLLFAFSTILALVLLIAAAFLTHALLGLSVPDPGPAPVIGYPPPRDTGPAMSESIIDVGGRRRATGDGTARTDTAETTQGSLPHTGATGSGPVFPVLCSSYGDEVIARRRYAHPVGYTANFKSDGVVFTLFDDGSLSTPETTEANGEEATEGETTGGEKESAQQ